MNFEDDISDENLDVTEEELLEKNKTRRKRRYIKNKRFNRLKRIINSSSKYAPHIGFFDYGMVDDQWVIVSEYIKYPRNSHKQRDIKRSTNKKIRKLKDVLKHNKYRRCVDYWNLMY